MESELEVSENASFGWFFNHLPAIMWQRRYFVAVPFIAILLAGVVAAFVVPTTYRSTALLLVEAQDLPEDLVQAPAQDQIDQRIARIRQQVLSRGDLIQLIEQDDLYPEQRKAKPLSQIIEAMRHNTDVGAVAGDIGQKSGDKSNTVAIQMSFEYPDPNKAQAVLQSFVSKFLSMDNKNVAEQATLTVRFLQDQADKLQGQIQSLEQQMTSLKARNGAALASSGAPSFVDTGSFTAQITSLQNENRQLLAQGQRPQQDSALTQAEAALAAAEAQYSDTHPDVVRAKERVRQLRQLASNTPNNDAASVQQQISANNAAIQTLMQQRDASLSRVNSAMAGQARAPAILEQAMQMENQANTLRTQYQQVSQSLLKAQNSARMATEQRAERLSLVEPASLPDRPSSPNRPLWIAAAAGAGLAFGLVLAFLVEIALRPIRSPQQLEQIGVPLIGVIPRFSVQQRRRLFGWREKRLAS